MVQELEIHRLARQVRDFVVDVQRWLAGFQSQRGGQAQLAAKDAGFFDNARHAHFAALSVDDQFHAQGRQIGDPPVQQSLQPAGFVPLRSAV